MKQSALRRLLNRPRGNFDLVMHDIMEIELEEIVVPKMEIKEILQLLTNGDIVGSTEIKIGECNEANETERVGANEEELIIKEI